MIQHAKFFLLTISLLGGSSLLAADAVTPVAVPIASGPAYPFPDDATRYAAQRAIDGDPTTFCCLLDDTRTGATEDTQPPRGAAPVSGHMIFDLGGSVKVVGVQLTARADGGPYNPKQVEFYCFADDNPQNNAIADDVDNDSDIQSLAGNHAFAPLQHGSDAQMTWPGVTRRFIGLRVDSSYESGGHHFNYQIAEIAFLVEVPPGQLPAGVPTPRRIPTSAETHIEHIRQDLSTLKRAIDHLGTEYPGQYPTSQLLGQYHILDARAPTSATTPESEGDSDVDTLREELESLKYNALVRQNPLLARGQLLFVKRFTYRTGWYYSEFMQAGRFGGNLCLLSLEDGKVTELLPQLSGGIFDRYDLSFDGRRVAFGYRPAPGKAFRLYEVGIDGTNLHALTRDPPDESVRLASYGPTLGVNELGPYREHTDDFHPCYLPDGGLCFASSRCERGVLCDQSDNLSVNVLYRIDGDGSNMRVLSNGALSESTPSMMNDGRILYTRWEYVDKGVIAVQSLWAMRPDGSGSCEIFGNHHEFPPVLIHGRALPESNHQFVCTATMHHPFAVGPIVTIDANRDIRSHRPIQSLTPDTGLSVDGVGGFPRGENFTHWKDGQWVKDNRGPLFCDPYPLSENFFLVACNPDRTWNDETAYGIWLIDRFGNRVKIYCDADVSCWQPMPVRPRPVPPAWPASVTHDTSGAHDETGEAVVALADVHEGLDGVQPGEIRYLRVWEQVPRPWSAHRFWPEDATLGQNAVISMHAHIYVKILHGIVPVEPDGSAHFVVPAEKNIFFQALDQDFMEVQRMRTFVNLQPGETRSCVGCHEPRNRAPHVDMPLAMRQPPVHPAAQPGESVPRPLYYPTDIQSILDKHCISCHGKNTPDADLELTGELTTFFSRSYESIMQRKLITVIQEFVGPQPRAQKTNVTPLAPRSLGSHASRLVSILRENHYDVSLATDEWIRLVRWVDANGPYYGTYFGRRNLAYKDHSDFRLPPALSPSREGVPP